MKWAPQRFNYKCARPMFEVVHGQTFQNNNYQILTKLETDKNVQVLGLKWDVKEIQVRKDLL
jgi:thiamine pyrophosphokinase